MVNNGMGISLEYDGNINITRPGKRLHNELENHNF